MQQCPICGDQVRPEPRYPRYVCAACVERAVSLNGRPVEFFESAGLGDYAARYARTGEDYGEHDCLIDGVRCRADVARFGGIVVEAYPDTDRTLKSAEQ